MLSSFKALALLLAGSSLVNASPLRGIPIEEGQSLQERQFVLEPQYDPWYAPPLFWETKAPGSILKTRKVGISVLSITKLKVDATQILYRSTSQNGSAIAGTTTIIVPPGASTDKFVTFLSAYDSVNSKCQPSYTWRTGSNGLDGSVITQLETLIGAIYLNAGYIITVPDHEGPNSAFASTRLGGTISLDAARATLKYTGIKWAANTNTVFVGYSGGAMAGGWAASLQPSYAPELPVLGFAFGGTPVNVSQVLEFIDGTLFSGFSAAGVTGLIKSYSALTDLFEKVATPFGKKALNDAKTKCVLGNLFDFAFQKLQSPKYQTLGDQLLYHPTVKAVTDRNIMADVPSETPTKPVYMYHAVNDEVIPISGAEKAYANWCSRGSKIRYVRDLGPSEHISIEIVGIPNAFNFVQDRFAGKPWISECTAEDSHLPQLTADSLGPTLAPILSDVLTLFTGRVGWADAKWKTALQSKSSSA